RLGSRALGTVPRQRRLKTPVVRGQQACCELAGARCSPCCVGERWLAGGRPRDLIHGVQRASDNLGQQPARVGSSRGSSGDGVFSEDTPRAVSLTAGVLFDLISHGLLGTPKGAAAPFSAAKR